MKHFLFLLTVLATHAFSQNADYSVYAVEFGGPFKLSANRIAAGGQEKDSVTGVYMVWLIRAANGKNILVDAGFTDSIKYKVPNYVRPDIALKSLGISAVDVTDVVISHTHWDHIGGVDLFPKATVWIQKADYEYFVGEAWQQGGVSMGLDKQDVGKVVKINMEGRLRLVRGDNVEIIPGIRVFIGSKHTFESQYVLVNANAREKIILASDNIWFYYNLQRMLPIVTYVFDPPAYVAQMKRMKTLATSEQLIIPGHDATVMKSRSPVAPGVVMISSK